jgi:hypothetical protein
MDSFINNPNKVSWPKAEGTFWFYGYRYGKISCGSKCDKELMLCTVSKISGGDLMVTGSGQFFFKGECEEAQFIPATLPELPE